jgi:hypothetical protein
MWQTDRQGAPRVLPDVLDRLRHTLTTVRTTNEGGEVTEPEPDPRVVTVNHLSAYVPISLQMAIDAGVMSEEEARAHGWTPAPPLPRRVRLRWRWQAWRERTGRRIGSWIAGVDLRESDDY